MNRSVVSPQDHQAYQHAVDAFRRGEYLPCLDAVRALALSYPALPEAQHLIGLCHYQLDQLGEAETAIRKAIALRETAEFYQNLALVLQKPLLNGKPGSRNRAEEAIAAFRRAIELEPSFSRAKETLAGLLARSNRPEEAFPLYKEIASWVRLQFEMRKIVKWGGLDEIDRLCLADLEKGASTQAPWNITHLPGATPAMQKRIARRHVESHIPQILQAAPVRPDHIRIEGRRIRLGYLSSDFYNHATMHLLAGVLEAHDSEKFEILLISNSAPHNDDYTRRLADTGWPLIDISQASDAQAANIIAQQKLDILVDLKGHTLNARLNITALRPAPIIVNWLGYPGTLGHPRLADYIIGDPVVTPPEHSGHFSERLALMPNSYQPNDASRPLPPAPSREEAGLPESGLVFCSFNQVVKYNPATFDVWARLLQSVPQSVLWLLQPLSNHAPANIKAEFTKRGIDAERVIFAPFVSPEKNIARLRLADAVLDTFPCNSHTTASDALWAGIPLVTMKGDTFASRVAASLLTAHGFCELITGSWDEYFALALKIASDHGYRRSLRQRLDDVRSTSPLFDTRRFATDLEALFCAIIDDYNQRESIRARFVAADGSPKVSVPTPSLDEVRNLYARADYDGASKILARLIDRFPHDAGAHHLLGACHFQNKRLDEAEKEMRKAISLRESGEFYRNLGAVLARGGKTDAAIDAYENALRLAPRDTPSNRGVTTLYFTKRQYAKAADHFRHLIDLEPENALWHKGLGSALLNMDRLREAEPPLRRALELDPSMNSAKQSLSILLPLLDRQEEAVPYLKSLKKWLQLQFILRETVQWDDLAQADHHSVQMLEQGTTETIPPLTTINMRGVTPDMQRRVARQFALSQIPELVEPPLRERSQIRSPDRPLRIGYLSSDFHEHATMHLLAGVLEKHDPAQHEIRIFSYGRKKSAAIMARLQRSGAKIIDLSAVDDRNAAEIIANENLDILVELKGYTYGARLGITALRPAPIIVNWLGYPGTLGHERLADYIIGDHVVTPPEHARHFSERLALMPNCYQPNDSERPLGQPPTRAQAGLPEKGIVFCSFNQAVKFNPQIFDIWARLLLAVPGSVLWLIRVKPDVANTNIKYEFSKRGISDERIIIAPPVPQAQHIARLRLADIALDTFPCTSHTTTSDALWAGVPLVTIIGDTFASRVAASILTAHGFSDLVTHDERAYFDLALQIATSPEKRAALRKRVDQARNASALFDTAGFTRDLERLFRAMLNDHNTAPETRPAFVGL